MGCGRPASGRPWRAWGSEGLAPGPGLGQGIRTAMTTSRPFFSAFRPSGAEAGGV